MKKKIVGIITILMILMPKMVLARQVSYVSCGNASGIPEPVPQMTSIAYTLLIIGTPLILIAFSIIALVKAITSGSQEELMKARGKLIKKFIAAGIIFIVAALVQFVITQAANETEKASIIGCINCFLYNDGCAPSDSGNNVQLPDGSSKRQSGGIAPSGLSLSGVNQPSKNSAIGSSCNSTTSTERTDYIFGKGKLNYGNYQPSTNYDCAVHKDNITSLTLNVWQVDSSGNWNTKAMTIEINKKLVNEMKNIFQEIYDESKVCIDSKNTTTGNCKVTPIKSIGGYRCPENCRNHPSGTAIDINPDENYYISGSKTVGKYWKPNVDIYSMPPDGIIVKTFKKYGWDWGGNWNSLKDYMHFSYLGG